MPFKAGTGVRYKICALSSSLCIFQLSGQYVGWVNIHGVDRGRVRVLGHE